jgi:MOSC domain-containing protein YiiM
MSADIPRHLTLDQLRTGLPQVIASPKDDGPVEMLVVRPEENERLTPRSVEVSAPAGLTGDHWATGKYRDRPDIQIAIINSRLLDLVSGGDRERWASVGDNIVVDLDLSRANLVAGQKLGAGSAVLEITDTPHAGCKKFASRFGADALRFVNLDQGSELRLRGVYARVLQAGSISLGDSIHKL